MSFYALVFGFIQNFFWFGRNNNHARPHVPLAVSLIVSKTSAFLDVFHNLLRLNRSIGSGAEKIIFVGTTHGDEQSSTYHLNNWVNYLETNALRIPAGRTIIVIPNLNPQRFRVQPTDQRP